MTSVGYATLSIIPSTKGFGAALNKQTNGAMTSAGTTGGAAMGTATKRSFLGPIKGLIAPMATIFAAKKVLDFGKATITAASDLGESMNAVNVVFGDAADGVLKLGQNAAKTVGLSTTEFNGLAVQFSSFAKTIAGEGGDVTGLLGDLTGRAADFASVMNLDVSDAARVFQSGLAGETEPLKKYGINLSAAAVEAYALSEGIVSSKKELDESAKVQARYGLLMEATAKTQGDFANTSDSLANRQRILGAQWTNMKSALGSGLLPIAEGFTGVLAGLMERVAPLAGSVGGLTDKFSALGDLLRGDFNSSVREAFGIEEDHPIVGALFTIREGFLGVTDYVRGQALPILRDLWSHVKTNVVPVFTDLAGFITGTLVPAAMKMYATIGRSLKPVLDALFDVIRGSVIPALQNIATKFREWLPTIMKVTEAVVFITSKALTFAAAILGKVLPPLVKLTGFLLRNVVSSFVGAIDVIIKTIATVIDFGVALVGAIAKVTAFASGIVNTIRRAFSSIINIVRSTMSSVRQRVSSALSAIRSAISSGVTAAKSLFRNGFRAIREGVSNALSGVMTLVRGIPGKIKSALGGLGSLLLNSGQNVISGFIRGIKSKAGAIVQTIKAAITDKLPGFVKSALGIRSPSRVFMALGSDTAEGFALGVEKGAKRSQAAMASVVAPPEAPTLHAGVSGTQAGAGYGRAAGGPLVAFNDTVIHEEVDVDVVMRRAAFALSSGTLGSGGGR